jgi:hypothetical protein
MQHARTLCAPLRCAPVLIAFAVLATAPAYSATGSRPFIGGSPATTATVGLQYSFRPWAGDPDHDALRFGVTNLPTWARFSTSSGQVAGTPADAQIGTYSNIRIWVSDGTSRAYLPAFSITVVGQPTSNKPPIISGTPPLGALVGQSYSFQPTAHDPQGRPLTFSIANQPAWAAFSTSTGQLSGIPGATNVGSFSGITIAVSDGSLSAALPSFTITVSGATGSNTPPTISGTPLTSVVVGNTYAFQPNASDVNNNPLTFSITNKPAWATFDANTGSLSGVPTAAQVGTTANIVISVSDGTASASLAPFSIAVTQMANGSATLSWVAPTQNTDGTAITDLAGYRISYGTSADALTQVVQIANPGLSSYVIGNLSPGTWFFGIAAYNSAGNASSVSNAASVTIN